MSISWNGTYVIADARLARVHGQRLAGSYGLRFGVDFNVVNWAQQPPFPVVMFLPATVMLTTPGGTGINLGKALPEVPMPFTVSEYSAGGRGLMFDLAVAPAAMEVIETARNGEGLSFSVALQAEVRRGADVGIAHEQVTTSFTVSDWLVALEQCGYGRSMLFEVPLLEAAAGGETWTKLLGSARAQFLKGHYAQAVGECRLVLEALTRELGQGQMLSEAITQHKTSKRGLTLEQRELILRQAAVDYCSLAHHVDGGIPAEMYDRRSAQMLLATAATLVSAAVARQAADARGISP